jgi:hypothetical protein
MFVSHISDERHIQNYKEFSNFNNKNSNNQIKKLAKDLNNNKKDSTKKRYISRK